MFALIRLASAPSRLVACGALAFTLCLSAEAGVAEPVLNVSIDQAKIAKVPDGTKNLVIGAPWIADVSLLHGNTMVLTGKGYGETNLIALDNAGNVLEEKIVRVEPTSSVLVVQRGMMRESYSCTPKCMPSVQLGDSAAFGIDVVPADQIKKRNDLAAPTAQTTK